MPWTTRGYAWRIISNSAGARCERTLVVSCGFNDCSHGVLSKSDEDGGDTSIKGRSDGERQIDTNEEGEQDNRPGVS